MIILCLVLMLFLDPHHHHHHIFHFITTSTLTSSSSSPLLLPQPHLYTPYQAPHSITPRRDCPFQLQSHPVSQPLTTSFLQQPAGILTDRRRLNVALTRAKRKLILIGDVSTLTAYHPFSSLINALTPQQMYRLTPGTDEFNWEEEEDKEVQVVK